MAKRRSLCLVLTEKGPSARGRQPAVVLVCATVFASGKIREKTTDPGLGAVWAEALELALAVRLAARDADCPLVEGGVGDSSQAAKSRFCL